MRTCTCTCACVRTCTAICLQLLDLSPRRVPATLRYLTVVFMVMGASIHLVGDSVNHRLIYSGYQFHLSVRDNPIMQKLEPPTLVSNSSPSLVLSPLISTFQVISVGKFTFFMYLVRVSEIGRYFSWLLLCDRACPVQPPAFFLCRVLLLGFGKLLSIKKKCHCRFVVMCVGFTTNCQNKSRSKSHLPDIHPLPFYTPRPTQ